MDLGKVLVYLRRAGVSMDALGFYDNAREDTRDESTVRDEPAPKDVAMDEPKNTEPMEIDQDPEEKVYELDDKTLSRIDRSDPRLNEFLRQMARYKHTRLEHNDSAGTLFATRKSNSRCVTLWVNGVKRRAILPKAPRCGHKTVQGRTCKRHTWESVCCQHRQ